MVHSIPKRKRCPKYNMGTMIMTFEEIWHKLKRMSQQNRKMLAYEMTLKGFKVGYIHPHYYFDAKAVHDILFYPPNSQHEIKDKDRKYYNALKEIVENDKEIHVHVNRYLWLPQFVNDWREGNAVKSYIRSRVQESYVNAYYRILPGKSLAGERPRSLFLWDGDGGEIIYKMTAFKSIGNVEELTFQRMDK